MTPARAPPQCLTSSYALGILFLFLVSLLWTACSIVVQHLYQDMEFDSPFLIVYIGTSLFSVFLPMRLCYERRRWLRDSFGVFRRCCCGCCCGVPGGGKEESESSDVAALEEEEERAVIIPWRHPPGGRTAVPLSDRSDWGLASLSDEDADDTTVLVRSGISAYQKDDLRVAGGRAAAVATAAAGAVEMKGSSWNDFRYEEDEEVEEKIPNNSTAENTTVTNNSHPQPTRRGNQTHHNRQLYQHYLLSHQDHISMASKVAPLWFLSNYFYAQSLQWTSIASSTVLASMGSLFAFGFATCSRFGDERVTRGKILGVLLCFFGGVATAWTDVDGTALDTNGGDDVDGVDGVDDQSQQLHHRYFFIRLLRHPAASPTLPRFISNITQNDSFLALLGDMAGLLSAVGYGAYTVLIRHLCPKDEDRMSMQLLFGYIGVWNMVLLFPAALWVAWPSDDIHRGVSAYDSHIKIWSDDSPPYSSNDVDPSEPTTTMNAPHSTLTWSIFLFLLLKGLLDNVLSDYLWARAVILTSATVASVGVGLTIPMAFVADWIMGNYKERSVGWGDVLGAVFVLLGFLFVNVNVFGEKGWDDGEGEEGNDDDEDEEEEEERLDFEMEDGMTAGSAHDVNILT